MSRVKIYAYDRCDTCRRAIKFLDGHNVAYDVVDITEQAPSTGELARMAEHVGDFRKLFNTSGQVYRALKLGEKVKTMTESEALRLLAGNGRLVKRPFVLTDEGGLVGFKEDQWKQTFGRGPAAFAGARASRRS